MDIISVYQSLIAKLLAINRQSLVCRIDLLDTFVLESGKSTTEAADIFENFPPGLVAQPAFEFDHL